MTKEDFINKYIYGVGNEALTDSQEAKDMEEDLDKLLAEQLRQSNVVRQSEQLVCTFCGINPIGGGCKHPKVCSEKKKIKAN